MKKYFVLFLALTACGGSGGGGASNKGITSVWTLEDNSFVFDLEGQTLPFNGTISFAATSGETCSCTAAVTGEETSGGYALVGCGYTGGGAGDPGCSALSSSGTYEAVGSKMQLCDSLGCLTYK